MRLLLLALTGCLPAALAFSPPFACDRTVDLAYVIDESGSINPTTQWPQLLSFLANLTLGFPSAAQSATGGVSLAYIGFGNTVDGGLTQNAIPLGSQPDPALLAQALRAFGRTGGGTATFLGLAEAQRQLLGSPLARSPLRGVARMALVVTDGDTDGGNPGTDLTIGAADALRSNGTTVAAVAVGDILPQQGARAVREMTGIVGGNLGLLFGVVNWTALEGVLSSISRIACEAPVQPGAVEVAITAAAACNTTIFLAWRNATLGSSSSLSLQGSVQGGAVRLCWSYVDARPLPALPPALTPSTTHCSSAPLPGSPATSATMAAFPFATPGAGPPPAALFVSLTALNASGAAAGGNGSWACGGGANLTTALCRARIASVLNAVPGGGAGAARSDLQVVQDFGSAGQAPCPACPPGAHLLFPFDAGVFLAGVCSSFNCSGGAQYLSSPVLESRRAGFQAAAAAFTVCRDCHASCSAGVAQGSSSGGGGSGGGGCVAPPEFLVSGATGQALTQGPLPPPLPPALLCSACSGGSLVNSSSDPALVSPSWTAMRALLAVAQPPTPAYPSPFFLPPPAFLSGTPSSPGQSGRCLLTQQQQLPCGSTCTSASTGACLPCTAAPNAGASPCEEQGTVPVPPPSASRRGGGAVNVATPVCPASLPLTLAERSTTLLITLCVPRPPALRPAPNEPLAPSTLSNCGAFLDTPASAATLTQLAGLLAVPPATLFLRSCLDTGSGNPNAGAPTLSGRRYIWGWQAQSSSTPFIEVLGARGALQNATRRANSNCSCDALVTYALVLGAAEPGQWSLSAPGVTGAATLPPLPSLTQSYLVMYQRATAARRILAASVLNTSAGLPLEPWLPPAARVGRAAAALGAPRRLFEPTGGFSPLICAPDSIQLLDACFDDSTTARGGKQAGANDLGILPTDIVSGVHASEVWTPAMLQEKNMLTMCGPPPPPEVFPSPPAANPLTPIIEAAAISGGVLFLLILIGTLLVMWASALKQRRLAVQDHKARVQRWKKRLEAEERGDLSSEPEEGGKASSLQWEDGILDADTRATKAVFAPTGSVGNLTSGSAIGRGTITAGMSSAVAVSAAGAGGASGGVMEWSSRRGGGGGAVDQVILSNPLTGKGASAGAQADGAAAASGAAAPAASVDLASARQASLKSRSKLGEVEDDWAGVPYAALSPAQKLVEWLLPGAYTLGMGLGRETVPPSHDITHALGPKRSSKSVSIN